MAVKIKMDEESKRDGVALSVRKKIIRRKRIGNKVELSLS